MKWKEIYSHYLHEAGKLYVERRFEELERLFTVMKGQIYDDDARQELEEFEAKTEASVQKQLLKLDQEKAGATNPLDRYRIELKAFDIWDWKLGELLRKHQELAKKYDLLTER